MRILSVLIFLSGTIIPVNMAHAAGPFDIGVEASVISSYQWRGAPFNDDPVLQPSITAGYGGLSLNLWGSIDLTDYQNKRYSLSELDYTLTWAHSLPFGELTAGSATYSYPGVEDGEPTTELMAGFEAGLPLSPSLSLFRDIDKADGMYVLLGAGGSIYTRLLPSVDVSASLGWGSKKHNIYYYGIDGMDGSLTDAAVTIGLPFSIGKTVSVAPHANYLLRIDKKMRDKFERGCLAWGLTVAGEF